MQQLVNNNFYFCLKKKNYINALRSIPITITVGTLQGLSMVITAYELNLLNPHKRE